LKAHDIFPTKQIVEEGDDGEINCRSASPPVWMHKGRILAEHYGKRRLRLFSLKKEQAGKYQCYGTKVDKYSFIRSAIIFVSSKYNQKI